MSFTEIVPYVDLIGYIGGGVTLWGLYQKTMIPLRVGGIAGNIGFIAFGLAAVHVGSSWLAAEQLGARPALSVSQRLFVTSNVFDTTKADRGFLFVDELQLTGSHALGPHLVYYGVAQYLDFRNPTLTLSPFLGTDLARGRFHAQLELRWLAATVIPESVAAGRTTVLGRGALSPTLGFRWDFGASR